MAFVLLPSSRFNLHCYTQCEAMPTQKLARKWQLWPFVTSCYERLRVAFNLTDQLRWTAQYSQLHAKVHSLWATPQKLDCNISQGREPLPSWWHSQTTVHCSALQKNTKHNLTEELSVHCSALQKNTTHNLTEMLSVHCSALQKNTKHNLTEMLSVCLQLETPLLTAGCFRAQDPGKYYGTSKKKKKKSYTVGAPLKKSLVVYICKRCFEPS